MRYALFTLDLHDLAECNLRMQGIQVTLVACANSAVLQMFIALTLSKLTLQAHVTSGFWLRGTTTARALTLDSTRTTTWSLGGVLGTDAIAICSNHAARNMHDCWSGRECWSAGRTRLCIIAKV